MKQEEETHTKRIMCSTNLQSRNTVLLGTKPKRRIRWNNERSFLLLPLVALLFLFTTPPAVHGFASYLLSRSNCWTELSTDEVIMNQHVVAADASEDASMRVRVKESEDDTTYTLSPTTSFPITLALQVVTDRIETNSDYQFVLEVNATEGEEDVVFFENGSCDHHKRVAGRGREIVELTLTAATTAQVYAGWACGHEAVRLTPILNILAAPPSVKKVPENQDISPETLEFKKEKVPPIVVEDHPQEHKEQEAEASPNKQQKQSWDEFVLSEGGCQTIQLSDANIMNTLHQDDVPISQQQTAELYVDHSIADRIPADMTIGLDTTVEWDRLVLQCNTGATFEASSCQGQRVAVSKGDPWPKLTIHEDVKIDVWGLYSQGKELYRAEPLELVWTPPVAKDDEPPKKEDPLQLVSPELLTAHQRKLHGQVVKKAKEQQEKLQKKIKLVNEQGRKFTIDKHEDLQKIVLQANEKGRKSDPLEKVQLLPHEKKHPRENVEPVRGRLDDHLRDAKRHSEEFSATQGSYFLGMAILIIAHVAAIQLCLVASRASKGRRDM
jgi:hypothetical protein